MDIFLSHWEKKSWLGPADYLIIGSGIVGLSAAIHLKERKPDARITILEKALIPCGGSTKNAGFTCFGSLSELLDDRKQQSMTEVMDLVDMRWRGLLKLRERIGETAMDYEDCGGYELFRPEDAALFTECREILPDFNTEVAKVTGLDRCYQVLNDSGEHFGFAGVDKLIINRGEGLIDTGKCLRKLLHIAQSLDILILTGAEVSHWEEGDGQLEVHCANGWKIKTEKLLLATNGFSQRLLPGIEVAPARAQVLITSEIPGLAVKGGFHYDRGYFYFRHVGKRILFGGGRNLDFQAEHTDQIELTQKVQSELERLLREVIIPGKEWKVEHRWAGVMGVGKKKSVLLNKISGQVFTAVRMGGMGVAIGSLVGENAAELMMAES